jgi:hypothetical protein
MSSASSSVVSRAAAPSVVAANEHDKIVIVVDSTTHFKRVKVIPFDFALSSTHKHLQLFVASVRTATAI